ncbi:putative bifunctional diguanylate cyclase/phosphodiesterase [Thermobrachium celere]|uniref:Diguanylate cyclase/phosphodiesterase (GGDEF & EAL domains) with PAS/PAC sensor(S) n=1 Tax=Thermobrachium celere DSM 8682 TaxID=941824 RepID=R7RRT7_9CLOT|nr:EAL domain-containing protein [Thermobrachium celere]CDF58779.1 diguanylate cyclase/phosphodiesterase (GGDEF & EAL domains) with PAS/PAC sensor(s) [Thermobrachium celere DSM 8682]
MDGVKDIDYLTFRDYLTGIYNRNYLEKFFRDKNYKNLAVVFLDFDNFKYINDTYGHHFGDKVLIKSAEKINSLINDEGELFRFGGDEFIIILVNKSLSEVEGVVQRIIDEFNCVFELEGKEIFLTLSAGIYMAKSYEDLYEIIRKADSALYVSKKEGKSKFTVFEEKIESQIKRRAELLVRLKKAVENKEFYLIYQPIFDVSKSKVLEVEVLTRWKCEDLGEISPSEFIPLLEETGLIREFGYFVLEEAFKQLKIWDDIGLELKLNINISPIQLRDKKLVLNIKKLKEKYKIDLSRVIIEITETQMIKNDEVQNKTLNQLEQLGISLAIDDYGTAYSQILNTVMVPAKEIKIAKEIIDLIDKDIRVNLMVKYMIELFRNLGYLVVAEGVENKQQFEFLKEFRCDKIQGYYIAKPMDNASIIELIKNGLDLK